MRMMRRIGLLGAGSAKTYTVTINSADRWEELCYVNIGGVDYQATARGQTWQLIIPEGTAATAYVVNSIIGSACYIYYLGRMVASTSMKEMSVSYDFTIDRDLMITYDTDGNIFISEA